MSYAAQMLPDMVQAKTLQKLMLNALMRNDLGLDTEPVRLTESEVIGLHELYSKLSQDLKRHGH